MRPIPSVLVLLCSVVGPTLGPAKETCKGVLHVLFGDHTGQHVLLQTETPGFSVSSVFVAILWLQSIFLDLFLVLFRLCSPELID